MNVSRGISISRVAVCCSVLQCVALCGSVLQCVAVCCSVLQCVAVCCCALQCVAVCVCVAVRFCVLHVYVFMYLLVLCMNVYLVSRHLYISHVSSTQSSSLYRALLQKRRIKETIFCKVSRIDQSLIESILLTVATQHRDSLEASLHPSCIINTNIYFQSTINIGKYVLYIGDKYFAQAPIYLLERFLCTCVHVYMHVHIHRRIRARKHKYSHVNMHVFVYVFVGIG